VTILPQTLSSVEKMQRQGGFPQTEV